MQKYLPNPPGFSSHTFLYSFTFGELRAFILNGVIYYIIYTTPKHVGSPALDLQVTPCYVVRPLKTFQ